MHSAKVDIFFSCSFAQEDKEVNEFVLAICRGLDLVTGNVSSGSPATPPNVALEKIKASQALIAVCTRRNELKAGGYQMPAAVHDEISIAFGTGTPLLMLREEGVSLDGFMSNFGTYLTFNRDSLFEPEFVQKLVESIHATKLKVLGTHQLWAEPGISDAFAEFVHHLVELKSNDDGFVWEYSTTKKLVYTTPSKRSFYATAWAVVPSKYNGEKKPIKYTFRQISSSNNMKFMEKIEEQSDSCVKSLLRPYPAAEAGDHIEYSTRYSSPFLNPIWEDEIESDRAVHLDDGDWKCADGFVFVHRANVAVIEFRFPRDYRISKSQIRTFVGSYTSEIDYEVPSELARCKITQTDFAENYIIRIEIERPLPGYMYGIAWNPISR